MGLTLPNDEDAKNMKEFVETIDKHTPLTWTPSILKYFPKNMREIYQAKADTSEQLKELVLKVSKIVQEPHTIVLFEADSNGGNWPAALKYFTDDETKSFFLPVLIYKIFTDPALQISVRVFEVMQRLSCNHLR